MKIKARLRTMITGSCQFDLPEQTRRFEAILTSVAGSHNDQGFATGSRPDSLI